MESTQLAPIQSISPPASWLGGKRLLAKKLDARISAISHRTYAEPFLGMGGVFFRRTKKARAEIVNDLNEDVINLFRILREHYPQFMDCLKYQITSRSEFERLTKQEASSLTDLQRAARFLYLQRQRFGGQVVSRSFAPGPMNPGRFDVVKLGPMLDAIARTLYFDKVPCDILFVVVRLFVTKCHHFMTASLYPRAALRGHS